MNNFYHKYVPWKFNLAFCTILFATVCGNLSNSVVGPWLLSSQELQLPCILLPVIIIGMTSCLSHKPIKIKLLINQTLCILSITICQFLYSYNHIKIEQHIYARESHLFVTSHIPFPPFPNPEPGRQPKSYKSVALDMV